MIDKLLIVIPHYGDRDRLDRCLLHVQMHTTIPYDVVIYDDASGTLPEDALPGVLAIRHFPFNTNFTSMCNSALLDYPGYRDYCLLNNDVVVRENWQNAVLAVRRDPQAAGATPMIRHLDDPDQIILAGVGTAFPGIYESGHIAQADPQRLRETRPVRWVPFTCAILKGDALRAVGLLDPNLRYICSDSDWSFRARWMGWTLLYVGSAEVLHAHTTTGPGDNPFLQECFLADRALMADKWGQRALLALDNADDGVAPYAADWIAWERGGGTAACWGARPVGGA